MNKEIAVLIAVLLIPVCIFILLWIDKWVNKCPECSEDLTWWKNNEGICGNCGYRESQERKDEDGW